MVNNIDNKVLPQSIEGEKAVLGAIMIEPEIASKIFDMLTEDHFYKEAHKRIFRVIKNLYFQNLPIDTVSVSEELKKEKIFTEIGGGAYLTDLINTVSTAANAEYYAQIVYEKGILRQLIFIGTQIAEQGYKSDEDVNVLLDRAEKLIFSLSQSSSNKKFIPVKDLTQDTLDRIEQLITDKKMVPGIPTGYSELDSMTAGLQPSNLVIIAGRPSMGKTSFCLNMVANMAIRKKIPVGFFSLEMSAQELMFRLVCSEARANAHEVRKGVISQKLWPVITNALNRISDSPIYIDDSSSINVFELRTRARKLVSELNSTGQQLGTIIIDYIQLMHTAKRMENRQQEMAEISRALKSLAKEINVPVIAVSQLSRKPEEKFREGRPQLSDLRESGALEQDADLVIFIYREEVYKKDPDLENKAKIIIAKQRNGPTGEIDMVFNKEFTRFEPLEKKAYK